MSIQFKRLMLIIIIALVVVALIGCVDESNGDLKEVDKSIYMNPDIAIDERVENLLSQMTLEEKIGQMTQVDRQFLKNEKEITKRNIGSILSGGGSAPEPNIPEAWVKMIHEFQSAALDTRLSIPVIYGIDAVHGNNNVYGATIFPHNIGLGATRNPQLVKDIGEITAKEVVGTGIHWTFSPCVCVAENERWGRTYESFSEDPEIVRSFTTIIEGYQGDNLNEPTSILATAKHWVGDGATLNGTDQGDAVISEEQLRTKHISPFEDAIDKGVGSIMVSFSSWNGDKLHGHKYLITDVLKDELGFTGFVVSDWAGVNQISENYSEAVRSAINAGVDMVMVPDDYTFFMETLYEEVDEERVSLARIDDAVRRILTKKYELGLFEKPYPDQSYTSSIGSKEHREVARKAVQQSLVLLKNEHNTLPLSKDIKKLFVAGDNANDIGNQSGGWTISWQGESGDITPGTTILEGIQQAVSPDTSVTFEQTGRGIDSSYDAAIIVIGETPYTEGLGDRPDFLGLEQKDIELLEKTKETGVPTVVVLVSGRPMIVTEQIESSDAFVAAWLPGTEGNGVADVLFGDLNFTGKLPMSWPRLEEQIPINIGDENYNPLFPLGFGLTY
ncbi:glycoside hydrolase family 3 protein [Chengkuizengella axinellae]|uniref:beta-glucosidase n=1 Tax=Chengkuizengella axinellae TaxID=3064388 RepID=A0ABT9IY45_9BACL|nr:glycoside hydrolase family 3 N-terminal domain-containing protein [Chengkuizengella sp. 2205SS18-9]MDP5274233.1 glycoside hydrolase family 3 N-terminal domain-containing protein [Chengkuizengella sp. 2205SS18-9]